MPLAMHVNKVYLVLTLGWGFPAGKRFVQGPDEKITKVEGWFLTFIVVKGWRRHDGEFP